MEVAESAVIDAPREAVVAVVDDPQTQVRVTPALTGIADVRQKPDGGRRMVYGYGVFGLVFTGALETTTYDPPKRIVFAMTGDLAGEIRVCRGGTHAVHLRRELRPLTVPARAVVPPGRPGV
jgi:carbon monoxide dehydrogenase subunit G